MSDRKPAQGQQRRGDIEQRRSIGPCPVPLHAWAMQNQHAEITMPHDRSGGIARALAWPDASAVESVIRANNDQGVGSRQFDEPMQHHVLKTVNAGDDVLQQLKLALADVRLPWRMERHESVRKVVNRVEVNRGEIPVGPLHRRRRRCLDRAAFAEQSRERFDAAVFRLINLRCPRNEGQDQLFRHFLRLHPKRPKLSGRLGRMNRTPAAPSMCLVRSGASARNSRSRPFLSAVRPDGSPTIRRRCSAIRVLAGRYSTAPSCVGRRMTPGGCRRSEFVFP